MLVFFCMIHNKYVYTNTNQAKKIFQKCCLVNFKYDLPRDYFDSYSWTCVLGFWKYDEKDKFWQDWYSILDFLLNKHSKYLVSLYTQFYTFFKRLQISDADPSRGYYWSGSAFLHCWWRKILMMKMTNFLLSFIYAIIYFFTQIIKHIAQFIGNLDLVAVLYKEKKYIRHIITCNTCF